VFAAGLCPDCWTVLGDLAAFPRRVKSLSDAMHTYVITATRAGKSRFLKVFKSPKIRVKICFFFNFQFFSQKTKFKLLFKLV